MHLRNCVNLIILNLKLNSVEVFIILFCLTPYLTFFWGRAAMKISEVVFICSECSGQRSKPTGPFQKHVCRSGECFSQLWDLSKWFFRSDRVYVCMTLLPDVSRRWYPLLPVSLLCFFFFLMFFCSTVREQGVQIVWVTCKARSAVGSSVEVLTQYLCVCVCAGEEFACL